MSQSVPKWQYRFGLIGKRLDYSFSPAYFSSLFIDQGLQDTHSYEAWEFADEKAVEDFLAEKKFYGCNVTIPYKLVAAQACDELVGFAAETGAVNTICVQDDKLVGYNTDVYGIIETMKSQFENDKLLRLVGLKIQKQVLILGTGGASRAVQAGCRFLNWPYQVLSRKAGKTCLTYQAFHRDHHLSEFDIIVNTTPLGMLGQEDQAPDIDIQEISDKHLVFDLNYNPKKTLLLERAKKAGAAICNGELMLKKQADLAWDIWNQSKMK